MTITTPVARMAGCALTATLTVTLTATLAAGCASSTPAHHSAATASARGADTGISQVVAISVDGLNPRALRVIGRDGTPVFHRLRRAGASTLDARTEREQTETLPNHTGMVTGRRIDAAHGGHGVTWNDERREPSTVQEAAGHDVASVFTRVHATGGRTGLFVSKAKLLLFERSWPRAVTRDTLHEDNTVLARTVRRDLRGSQRGFRLVHLSAPDLAGHAHGFMSRAYLRAVRRADRLVGEIWRTLRRSGHADDTALIVTADHGGEGASHVDPTRSVDYRIPFWVVGPGVARGADLYALNPSYADPGRRRTSYAEERQPVRNGDVANLALDLLGIDAVPGSEHDAAQDLRVSPTR